MMEERTTERVTPNFNLDSILASFEETCRKNLDRNQMQDCANNQDFVCAASYRIRSPGNNYTFDFKISSRPNSPMRKSVYTHTGRNGLKPRQQDRKALSAISVVPCKAKEPEKKAAQESIIPEVTCAPEPNQLSVIENGNKYTESEQKCHGVSELNGPFGRMRIVNTEMGLLYSANDILILCQVKTPDKWLRYHVKGGNARREVNLLCAIAPTKCKSGKIKNMRLVTVGKESAEAIMAEVGCPPDRELWIQENVFNFKFVRGASKMPLSKISKI